MKQNIKYDNFIWKRETKIDLIKVQICFRRNAESLSEILSYENVVYVN